MPEWSKGPGCKPDGFAYGGSNPPTPINLFGKENDTKSTCTTRNDASRLAMDGRTAKTHCEYSSAG